MGRGWKGGRYVLWRTPPFCKAESGNSKQNKRCARSVATKKEALRLLQCLQASLVVRAERMPLHGLNWMQAAGLQFTRAMNGRKVAWAGWGVGCQSRNQKSICRPPAMSPCVPCSANCWQAPSGWQGGSHQDLHLGTSTLATDQSCKHAVGACRSVDINICAVGACRSVGIKLVGIGSCGFHSTFAWPDQWGQCFL